MTKDGFEAARYRLKLRRFEFALEIGIARETARAYETGTSRIPIYIALAIGALLYGLPPAE